MSPDPFLLFQHLRNARHCSYFLSFLKTAPSFHYYRLKIDHNSIIRRNLEDSLGLSGTRAFIHLGGLRQDHIEDELASIPGWLPLKRRVAIYMKWLFQQDLDEQEHLRKTVVGRWVSFVSARGLGVREVITLWAEECRSPTIWESLPSEDEEPLGMRNNRLRQEIECHFFNLNLQDAAKNGPADIHSSHGNQSRTAAHPPSSSILENHILKGSVSDLNSNTARKPDELQDERPGSAILQNWPTRDIPFQSIESPESPEQNEASFATQSDTTGDETNETDETSSESEQSTA
jgi:hypothetical protein